MSLPNNRGRCADPLLAGTNGNDSTELCSIRFTEPTPYRLRFVSAVGAGFSDNAGAVYHTFSIDDGLGDGELEFALMSDLNAVFKQRTAMIYEGVGLDVRVRCVSTCENTILFGRPCVVSAAISPIGYSARAVE
jgi:hypothetical protein